ncbi:hypothetical protein, partial [Enterococcus hirae]|uniref:hypothetical protein n=1 Tax=Enterococcus hirae TaxID=1354 RepID=UPI001F24548E
FKKIRKIYGEESAQNRKNKFDFDNKHQNRTYFLFEKELLSHSRSFYLVKIVLPCRIMIRRLKL